MAQTAPERVADSGGITAQQWEVPLIISRESLTAAALPPLMEVDDPRGPYRFPLLQFIADWNVSDDKARLIADPPAYDGNDPILRPAIAVVVHALSDRAGVPIPDWVFDHRAPLEFPPCATLVRHCCTRLRSTSGSIGGPGGGFGSRLG